MPTVLRSAAILTFAVYASGLVAIVAYGLVDRYG